MNIIQNGIAPTLTNIINRKVISTSIINEIQSITITSEDGLLFGEYSIDFNNSGIIVLFRPDDDIKDFETKFESLPTVGDVSITRTTIQDINNNNLFLGYTWSITFLTNQGDLPLISVQLFVNDITPQYTWMRRLSSLQWYDVEIPSSGASLNGKNLNVHIEEVVKGTIFDTRTTFTNLIPNNQYSLEIFATNSPLHNGISTTDIQSLGLGVLPMSLTTLGRPDSPSIISLNSFSESQLEIQVNLDENTGGSSSFNKYLLEYTTSDSFTTITFHQFSLYNINGKVSNGYWRLFFQGSQTQLLKFNASADEIQNAINLLPSITNAVVIREDGDPLIGEGYIYTVTLSEAIGSVGSGDFTADLSQLSSESLNNNFQFEVLQKVIDNLPENYGSIWLYNNCEFITIGSPSQHQIITIEYERDIGIGLGSFRLQINNGGNGNNDNNDNDITLCLSFDITPSQLESTLENLLSQSFSEINVYEEIRNIGIMSYRDLHIFIEGVTIGLEYPTFRISSYEIGQQWPIYSDNNCIDKEYSTTNIQIISIVDQQTCLSGTHEIQTLVLDSSSTPGGYFYLSFNGEKTNKLLIDSTAKEVEDELNNLNSLSNISVSKYYLGESSRKNIINGNVYSYSWVITFPTSLGNVENLIVDDQFVTGEDVSLEFYQMINISMRADENDISGHFRISVGDESTIPLSWDASDATILNALNNLTTIGKVTILGYERNLIPAYKSYSTILTTNSYKITIMEDLTGRISIGDPIIFDTCIDTVIGRYVTNFTVKNDATTIITLSESTSSCSGNDNAKFRIMSYSKNILPGRVSIESNRIMYSRPGLVEIKTISDMSGHISINGDLYTIALSYQCGILYCLNLTIPYQGIEVFNGDIESYAFPQYSPLYISESWSNLLQNGDKI